MIQLRRGGKQINSYEKALPVEEEGYMASAGSTPEGTTVPDIAQGGAGPRCVVCPAQGPPTHQAVSTEGGVRDQFGAIIIFWATCRDHIVPSGIDHEETETPLPKKDGSILSQVHIGEVTLTCGSGAESDAR